ncbi:MAG: two-component system sensor histidine kinase PhoQ [Gammaproteobacteria bacterium]|jgi:two-component system sensor histidine kinase PhoQ
MNSLRTRMVVLASVVLATFLGFTAVALERAFTSTALELVHDHLQAQVYALLATADVQVNGPFQITALREPRFSLPNSGLYAMVRSDADGEVWRSPSLLDHALDLRPPSRAGTAEFGKVDTIWGDTLFFLSYRVHWELAAGQERVFDLHVAQTPEDFNAQVASFRTNLWRWLAGLAVGLLLMQALVLRFGLAPLARLSQQLRAIESGERESLSEQQPTELRALVGNMNQLIRSGRSSLERHRNALADLAHALKTPLAVLRAMADDMPDSDAATKHTLHDSIARMDEAISYRLRRASAAGETTLGSTVDVHVLAQRLRGALLKVYADKALTLTVFGDARVLADEGDLTEILGNLLDNACKWSQSMVRIQIDTDTARGLRLLVQDDGPGIAAKQRVNILQRGVRADEHPPGQGLGLALVRELVVDHYGGHIALGETPSGGAEVSVFLNVSVM